MLVASVASIYMIQRLHIIDFIKSKVNGVEQLFPLLLEVESDNLSAQINLLSDNEKIKQAWITRDRNSLLRVTEDLFAEIKEKYEVTHFYFIDLDKNCFLRVHNPDRHSDFIKRATLNSAVRKGYPTSGIELGPLGTFTLRVVYPWIIDGALAGYIELGKEILHITPLIKSSLDVDLVFVIDKSRLNRSDWEEGMRMLNRDVDWDLFQDSVVIDYTKKEIPQQLGEMLSLPHKDHAQKIISITEANTELRVMFLPLIDASATNIGDIIVSINVNELIYDANMVTLSIMALFILIGSILSAFMYFFIIKTEQTLDGFRNELLTEIEERKKTEEELTIHRNNLEHLVEERTRELHKSLQDLMAESDEREMAEEALRLSEAQFRGVFEGSAVGITISDTTGHIIACNPAYQEMLGYNEDELKQINFSALTYSADVQKHFADYQELLQGKRDYFVAEKRYVRKDGEIIWGQLTVSLVRDKHREPLFVIGLIENIGERKQLEEERLKASKLESIGILAGGIAHDFNNLLTAIIGNISLAKNYLNSEDKAAKRLEQAEKALRHTRELTHQLLTFSKGGEPIKSRVAIADLVKESASFALRGANVICEYDFADDIWSAEVDIGQFSQVIQNLIINADQAMPGGGTITISADNYKHTPYTKPLPLKEGKYIRLSINDQGKGIAQDDLTKVFDPYFTTKKEGSGLGLSIVHSVVRNHDGHISVDSKPGAGSTFTLYLPAYLGKEKLKESEEDKIYKGSGRILLMDDEEMIRDFGRVLLDHLGYEVEIASDGDEAIKLYQSAIDNKTPFDAVIMDITVPGGMGGKEAIEEILKIDPEAKVIVSSGYTKDPIMSDFKKYGFVGVVPKPYRIEEISQELHHILSE
jgi:PAS domain S-box-containing protein